VGIYDRDYMRSEPAQPGIGLTTMIRVCAIVASIVIAFICLRVPMPVLAKLALVLFASGIIWWLFSIPRKIESDFLFQQGRQLERNGNREAAGRSYEQALIRSPNDTAIALRLLAAYNSTLQINKARDLIQRLNGRQFQENEIEELEAIVTQYRRVNFEKHDNRQVMQLTD